MQYVRLLNGNIGQYHTTNPLGKIIREIGLPIGYDKWFTNLYEKGNTGSASIYIILEEFSRVKNFKGGEKILCLIPESGRFSTAYILLEAVVK